jgi:hypothetical protein
VSYIEGNNLKELKEKCGTLKKTDFILGEEEISYTKSLKSICDNIYFLNGKNSFFKILEINDFNIICVSCDEPNGEKITIKKTDVIKIIFANGTEEVFNLTSTNKIETVKTINENDEVEDNQEEEDESTYSLMARLILGLLYLLLTTLIITIKSLFD